MDNDHDRWYIDSNGNIRDSSTGSVVMSITEDKGEDYENYITLSEENIDYVDEE